MSNISTIVLVPFILAFLIFVLRFYGRESAASIKNPSFLFGVGSMASALCYLGLRITDTLPPYGTIGFGILGFGLLATAIARMFMI